MGYITAGGITYDQLYVRTSPEVRDAIDALVGTEGRSRSRIIEKVVVDWLNERHKDDLDTWFEMLP